MATKGFVPSPFERLAIPSATRALSAVMEAQVTELRQFQRAEREGFGTLVIHAWHSSRLPVGINGGAGMPGVQYLGD